MEELLHNSKIQNGTSTIANTSQTISYNYSVIIAAMICAFVCALGLNSMLQCIFRCAHRTLIAEPAAWFSSRRSNAGLKREHVASLPISTYSCTGSGLTSAEEKQKDCPICLSDFKEGDEFRVLPACRHRFHVKCIDTWLLSNCSCPTCRNLLSKMAKVAENSDVSITVV